MTNSDLRPQEGGLHGSSEGTCPALLWTHLPPSAAVQTRLISEKSVYLVGQEVEEETGSEVWSKRDRQTDRHTHRNKASERW